MAEGESVGEERKGKKRRRGTRDAESQRQPRTWLLNADAFLIFIVVIVGLALLLCFKWSHFTFLFVKIKVYYADKKFFLFFFFEITISIIYKSVLVYTKDLKTYACFLWIFPLRHFHRSFYMPKVLNPLSSMLEKTYLSSYADIDTSTYNVRHEIHSFISTMIWRNIKVWV